MSAANRYDAIVVGSGISGGWAAKELTEKGLRTLVLERCRDQEHQNYPTEHRPTWAFPLREHKLTPAQAPEHPIQAHTPSFREATRHYFLEDAENPYVQAKPFLWVQGNQVGGRSLIWGRQCYRWSDLDFEANLKDGHGVDWPIRYADIAPWYSYVERFVGISGEKLGLPQLPDGEFQPPMEMNAGEKWVKARLERRYRDRRLTIGRTAVLTQAIGDRLPCHYCGPCARGCSTGSYFSSQASTLPAARKTGRLTLRPYSLVHSIVYDLQRDRATGVRVVDTQSGEMQEFYARVIFLCASTLATTRVLLNSTTRRHLGGMETAALEYPSTMVTTPTGETTIPAALRRYRPKLARASEIRTLRHLPELTVVWTKGIDALLSHRTFLRTLAERLTATPEPSKIVFLFQTKSRKASERDNAQKLIELFGYFTRPFDLEVAQGIQAGEDAFSEAMAKIVATRQLATERTEKADHLGDLKKVIEATADLRAESGKLSATSIASAFGLSVAELAALVGRTRQTASKTPDADALQPLLQPFERVVRVRAVLGQNDFRKWLHLANEELDSRTPFEMIRQGKVVVVADLVEDMLTGSPS